MAAAAVPALIKMAPIAAGLAGSLFGKKTAKANPMQQGAMDSGKQSVNQLSTMSQQAVGAGQQNMNQAADYMGQAGNYYGKILSGGRGSMDAAMAPELAQTNDFYSGAANKVGRTMRGGSRDFALAELDREKVGKMSMMGTVARGNAAQGVERIGAGYGNMGATQMGQGMQGQANAGYLNNMLFNQGTQVDQQQEKAGSGWGKFLFDAVSSGLGGLGKKKPMGGLYGAIPGLMKSQNVSAGYH